MKYTIFFSCIAYLLLFIGEPVFPYAIGFEPPEELEDEFYDTDLEDNEEYEDEEVIHIDSFEHGYHPLQYLDEDNDY